MRNPDPLSDFNHIITATTHVFEPVELALEDEDELDEVSSLMSNSSDCARMVFCSVSFLTKFTRKPLPVGQPPLGALTVVSLSEESTLAASIWLLSGITERSCTQVSPRVSRWVGR